MKLKIELYLVKWSSGSYDDYRESNDLVIYATREAADKRMYQVIENNSVNRPFPFDWCTEDQFTGLLYEGKVTDEDTLIYDDWCGDNQYAQDFGRAWVQVIELDLVSWRERQLNFII